MMINHDRKSKVKVSESEYTVHNIEYQNDVIVTQY
jgi:hypothetical protein